MPPKIPIRYQEPRPRGRASIDEPGAHGKCAIQKGLAVGSKVDWYGGSKCQDGCAKFCARGTASILSSYGHSQAYSINVSLAKIGQRYL